MKIANSFILSASAAATCVLAQVSSSYTDRGIKFQGFTDPTYNLTIGFVTPPEHHAAKDEFIGEIVSPVSNKWVGIALAGKMADDLLLVAWPSNNSIVASSRFTTGHFQPTAYAGPKLTTLHRSSVDAETWRWVFLCQNCTSWSNNGTSGTMNMTSAGTVAYAIGLLDVDDPTDAESDFSKHNATGTFSEAFVNASSSHFEALLF